MKPKVICIHEHPGGAAALLPVISLLEREGKVDVDVNPSKPGNVDFVLTATDADPYQRCGVWMQWAKKNGVPSAALLDFWSNYRRRFEIDGKLYVPDTICVMDELAVHEMIDEGFHRDWLTITGQPAFDCLADVRHNFTERRRYWTERYYGFRPGRKTIVFCSQPLANEPYDYGFTEHTVLPLLLDALPDDVDLIIRPHPREKLGDLEQYARPNVTIQRKGMKHELLMASDLVVGMNSEILVEAYLLGCVVISIQPNIFVQALPMLPGITVIGSSHWINASIHANLEIGKYYGREPLPDPAAPKVAAVVYERLGV